MDQSGGSLETEQTSENLLAQIFILAFSEKYECRSLIPSILAIAPFNKGPIPVSTRRVPGEILDMATICTFRFIRAQLT